MEHINVKTIVSAVSLLCLLTPSHGLPDPSHRALSSADPPAERRCFATSNELRQAVDAYLSDNSTGTDVAATYGWPIGTWCVDDIENFNGLFSWFRNRQAATFNEDISSWNVSRATSMRYMFLLARDFNQDLCAWGDHLDVARTPFDFMFRGSSCPSRRAPFRDVVPAGPFCHCCLPQGPPSPLPSTSPTQDLSAVPSMEPTTFPTPELSESPSSPSYRCFEDTAELRTAVAAYLVDGSSGTEVARTYGWPIGTWCVSAIEDFSYLFEDAVDFDEYLLAWDVSNAKSMVGMFYGASSFNQPIDAWDLSSVEDIHFMFSLASRFNQPIRSWDVSNVKNFTGLFASTVDFNEDVGGWNTSSAVSMFGMFASAASFNQPIGNWDVSKVKDMSLMFFGAASFNQSIEDWDVTSVEDLNTMFYAATDFSQDLCGWGDHLTVAGSDMFVGTSCRNTGDPDLSATPPGPFCYNCM